MVGSDTPAHVRQKLVEVFAAQSGEDRLIRAMQMADEVRLVTHSGIRHRHPDWTNAQVAREWLRILHGPAVADAVRGCSSNS